MSEATPAPSKPPPPVESAPDGRAVAIGAVLQGVALGTLLFIAICRMLAMATGVTVFRYQAF